MAVVIDISPSSYNVGIAGQNVPTKVSKKPNEVEIAAFDRIFTSVLKVDMKGKTILLSNSLETSEEENDKLKQAMFDKFDVKGLYITNQSVLSLFATGHKEGLVVRSSETKTIIAPVIDGYVVKSDVMIINVGIEDLLKSTQESEGIHHHIQAVIEKSAKKNLLYKTIVLAGGPYVSGFREKLQRELTKLNDYKITVKVIGDYPQPEFQAFVGGSTLANLPEFKDLLIKESDLKRKPPVRQEPGSKAVVIDVGSRKVHVGYAGDRNPLVTRENENIVNVLQTIFNDELKVSPEKSRVLVSVSVVTPEKEKDDLVKVLFEKFKVPSLYIANQSVLSLYATGHEEGLVIDSSETRTCIAPIIDGFVVRGEVKVLNVGRDGLLQSLIDVDGIHQQVNTVIQKSSKKEVLYQTIILAGGAIVSGFGEKLQKEMAKFHSSANVLDYFSNPDHQAWIGGSILASLPDFQNMFVSKVDYQKQGVQVVHEKCK